MHSQELETQILNPKKGSEAVEWIKGIEYRRRVYEVLYVLEETQDNIREQYTMHL